MADTQSRYAWVAFLVCPRCGCTWRGILPGERPGAEGPILEQCPDCDIETDERNLTDGND